MGFYENTFVYKGYFTMFVNFDALEKLRAFAPCMGGCTKCFDQDKF